MFGLTTKFETVEGTVDRCGTYSSSTSPINVLTLQEFDGRRFYIGSPQSNEEIALIEKGDSVVMVVDKNGWINEFSNRTFPEKACKRKKGGI